MSDDPLASCRHCDRHEDPRRRPWSVWPSGALDDDGKSRYLIVSKADEGHVSEVDAAWLRLLISDYRADSDLTNEADL